MSKSYGNAIAISDPPEALRKKVASMITDPARIKKEDKGHPQVCTIYEFYQVFAKGRTDKVSIECRQAQRGCVECKKELAQVLIDYLQPIHERRKEFLKRPEQIQKILADGAEKAREIAAQTLSEAKKAMGLIN